MLLFGFLAAALAGTTASAAQPYQDVKAGSVTLRVPYPDGYCLPNGDRAEEFAKLAAGDRRNVTLLTLVDCKPHSASNRYLIVKEPVSSLDMPVDRAEMIKEVSATFTQPDVAAELKLIPQTVATDKSAATGVQINVVSTFSPRGHDDVCVYLGGPIATTKLGKTHDQAGGTCLTVVGARVIALNAYDDTNNPQAFKSLLPQMKLWALQIRPAP